MDTQQREKVSDIQALISGREQSGAKSFDNEKCRNSACPSSSIPSLSLIGCHACEGLDLCLDVCERVWWLSTSEYRGLRLPPGDERWTSLEGGDYLILCEYYIGDLYTHSQALFSSFFASFVPTVFINQVLDFLINFLTFSLTRISNFAAPSIKPTLEHTTSAKCHPSDNEGKKCHGVCALTKCPYIYVHICLLVGLWK